MTRKIRDMRAVLIVFLSLSLSHISRLDAAIDHAPASLLLRQMFPEVMTRPSRFLCPECAKRHSLAVSHLQNLGGETGAGKAEVRDDEEEQVSCWECEMFKKIRNRRQSKTPADKKRYMLSHPCTPS